jgi:cellobiose phosphorylase
MKDVRSTWRFTDPGGSFEWENPHAQNQLYFPICNEAGMMGSVTPTLHGDCTTGQHTFVRPPLVIESLHSTSFARNFWIYSDRSGAYSLTGNSAKQRGKLFTGEDSVDVTISGTLLAYTLTRIDRAAELESAITIFCPVTEDTIEIIWIRIKNLSAHTLTFVPTTCLPLYGRSADNLRDHNHWTSMSHRLTMNEYGMSVKPAMQHDERGHRINRTTYFVLATGGSGEKPEGQFPTVAEFIGERGSFDWPQAVVENIAPYEKPPNRRDGMEAVGAIRFRAATLEAGESAEFVVMEGATENEESMRGCVERYGSSIKAQKALDANRSYWKDRVERISFRTGDVHFNTWMRWVSLQPILRTIYGNSFLPHFDYGRGGRGWRDLWQDCLALLLQAPEEVRETLVSNFAGVRLDGSNATIIEKGLGNFAADRNRISRVWMDHGAWPLFTTKLYIDQTGDIEVLFQPQTYWKDHQIRRAKAVDGIWKQSDGTAHRNTRGEVCTGTLIEHILVQHLTCFHNVGDHNHIKLEDGDWNDLLDMANVKGESVAFTAFYGYNLLTIAELLSVYRESRKKETIELFRELLALTCLEEGMDYDVPDEKRRRLSSYLDLVQGALSGEKVQVPLVELIEDLKGKGQWILKHVRGTEWIESKTGHGFFNGYYDNDGERVDGDDADGPRMNLTAQAFAIMSGAASDEQVARSYRSAGAILKDPHTGGYRLTTPLGRHTWNFGRGFAVVYGEKETGGMFSHMAVIFMNALYKRGFVREGYEVFCTIYRLANDTEKAKIYPGIPEYINHEGTGKYHYLTGSASWLLMTVLIEMYGFRGDKGDLLIQPKLVREQFDEKNEARAYTSFIGRRVDVVYRNRSGTDYADYRVAGIRVNSHAFEYQRVSDRAIRLDRVSLARVLVMPTNLLEIELAQAAGGI